ERYRAISNELSIATLQFSEHNLAATNAYSKLISNKADLDGIPQSALDAATLAAKESEETGWRFTLQAPSVTPILKYATNRELRKEIWMAYNTRCIIGEFSNTDIIKKIVNLRLELAQIMGYNSHAEYVLSNRMAQTTDAVTKLLDELIEAYTPTAKKELNEVKAMAHSIEGADFELMPWDTTYYTRIVREKRFNFDSEELRPYFELSKVCKGIFGLASRLYGITFKENNEIEKYNKEVHVFEVFDKDDSFLALLYTDFHPRSSKQSGAWMSSFKDQDGTSRPHVMMVMNFTKPTETKPALLTFDEVNTMLHEFGHCLHGIFANSKFTSLSGTNVKWDFVELPSQLMENFATEPKFLDTFAYHYETGELLPKEMINKIVASANFHASTICIRQVSLALLDMAWHARKSPFEGNILSYEIEAKKQTQLLPTIPNTCMSTIFSHIFSGGYSAGYYSYKWAEVLDADAFSRFKKEGIFSREVANDFRREILSKGNTAHPMTLYLRFRHQPSTIDALLIRDGLMTAEENIRRHQCEKQQVLDKRYMRMAVIWAENSYCKRRQVGCLIVKDKRIISDGYNGTPVGFENICEDETGLNTKPYVLHAEANAITKLATANYTSNGATLYVTASPCIECAKLIIQAGIKRVIYGEKYRLTDGLDLLKRASIEVTYCPLKK
ncbi:MAG: M3 family metallopeptidase, partial [Bacteroidaceae bacterium]